MHITVREAYGRFDIDVEDNTLPATTWVGLNDDGQYVQADGLVVHPLLVLTEASAGRDKVNAARAMIVSLWEDTPPIGHEYWVGPYKVGQVLARGLVAFENMGHKHEDSPSSPVSEPDAPGMRTRRPTKM